MSGKVNPTQAEALTMVAVQVMANEVAIGFGGSGGYLEMNVYKPLIIYNVQHSIALMADSCTNFRKFLIEGTEPNLEVDQAICRALADAGQGLFARHRLPQVSKIALDNDFTLKAAALKLGNVSETEFDRGVDPAKMVRPLWRPPTSLNPKLDHCGNR
jgi:fumarate hydratase class II